MSSLTFGTCAESAVDVFGLFFVRQGGLWLTDTQHTLELFFLWRLCCKILWQSLPVQGGDDFLWKPGINFSSDCDSNNEAYFLFKKCRSTSVCNYIFLNNCSMYLLALKLQTWVLREDVQAEIQMWMVFDPGMFRAVTGAAAITGWNSQGLKHPHPVGQSERAQSLTPTMSWPLPALWDHIRGMSSGILFWVVPQRIHLKFLCPAHQWQWFGEDQE